MMCKIARQIYYNVVYLFIYLFIVIMDIFLYGISSHSLSLSSSTSSPTFRSHPALSASTQASSVPAIIIVARWIERMHGLVLASIAVPQRGTGHGANESSVLRDENDIIAT